MVITLILSKAPLINREMQLTILWSYYTPTQRAKSKTTDNVKGSLKCATMGILITAGECVNSYGHFGNWHRYESSRTYIYHRTQTSTSSSSPREMCAHVSEKMWSKNAHCSIILNNPKLKTIPMSINRKMGSYILVDLWCIYNVTSYAYTVNTMVCFFTFF